MKKTLLLILAAGLVCSTSLKAADLFITGSTAFRTQVYAACSKLFNPAPTILTGTGATGGDTKTGSSAAQWTMTGTPITGLTQISGTLTIHGLFTGSVQGCQTVENSTKLFFLDVNGKEMTNTPTIAFSDVSSASTPYPVSATANFSEESVAVQPFVMCRAVPLTTISNVANEQLKYAIQAGRIPLSSWSNKSTDHSSFVYLIQRTQDSGTRRTELAVENDGFNQSAIVYLFDVTNNVFYKGTNELQATLGGISNNVSYYGVVGAAGNNGANLQWGPGYVGGGDVKTELATNNPANQAFGILSLADAQGITGVNWSQVMSFDGAWPTAAGFGITAGTGTTNDFSPIVLGQYALWATEVVVYPLDPGAEGTDQNLTAAELGDQSTPGTLLGVLDYQTKISNPGGPTIAGSLENEIQLSKSVSPGATAIRLSDMTSSRASVGGTITP